jgi:subtilase family serine protease
MHYRRSMRLLLLSASVTLLSQIVYGQNVAYPVVPASSITTGYYRPFMWVASTATPAALVHAPGQTACDFSDNLCYYLPTDLYTAYQTPFVPNNSYGQGITIGIVDAYYNSQTLADLIGFSTAFSLPLGTGTPVINCTTTPTVTIVGQTGGAPTAGFNADWAQETDLDMQWAHAIAPCANLLLVTATNNSSGNLLTGLTYAIAHADVVTNSYGGSESGGETADDPTYSGSMVPILFSAGDTGAEVEYPCASPYVTCVGGTHLLTSSTGARLTGTSPAGETPWNEPLTSPPSGGGGGCSVFEAEPAFQSTPAPGYSNSICGSFRGVPDIAALADDFTGVVIYFGTNIAGTAGVYCCIGGTSLASPLTAGMIANIDASRVKASKAKLSGPAGTKNLTPLLYNAAAGSITPSVDYGGLYHFEFYDVLFGSTCQPSPSTTCFAAGTGWDAATGLGVLISPYMGNFLVNVVP